MDNHYYLVLLFATFVLIQAKKDRDINCSVCRFLVDEINWSISQIDPKKTIQVGSFRVDTNGNQATYKIPYARSETYLTELFEDVCDQMNQYAETTLDKNGRKSLIRTSTRDGVAVSLENIEISSDKQKLFRHMCNSILEDNEEEMIALFRKDSISNLEEKICVEVAELCSVEDLKIPLPVGKPDEEMDENDEKAEDNSDYNDDEDDEDSNDQSAKVEL